MGGWGGDVPLLGYYSASLVDYTVQVSERGRKRESKCEKEREREWEYVWGI